MKTLRFVFVASVLVALASGAALAQSITNTLGATGVFKIKDGTSDFFSLGQANGNSTFLRNLEFGSQENSSATVGVITKGGTPFIHNYNSLTNSGGNTFVGLNSGNFTMTGALGFQASSNTGIGMFTLGALTTGSQNSALGTQALGNNADGAQNVALGSQSLAANVSGGSNTAAGVGSLVANVSGSVNSAFGNGSLSKNTGDANTALGVNAGNNVTSGSNLTLLGANAHASTATAADEITFGDASIAVLRCNTQAITSLSDARDKKNIRDLQLGMDFLMKLKPRLFNWDRREWYENHRSDGSKMQQTPTAGFIAQELDEVQTAEGAEWLKLVLKNNPERLEATAGNLLPIVVKAVQELKKENDALKVKVLAQQQEVESLKELKAKLATLEQAFARSQVVRDVSLSEQR